MKDVAFSWSDRNMDGVEAPELGEEGGEESVESGELVDSGWVIPGGTWRVRAAVMFFVMSSSIPCGIGWMEDM